ncbi:hypothetical protein [Aneurinibacillus tyrosinisolvens]|uniref:hypothetical protein n=1 Tax=Aneurinibacillus tyrosinisolvens TaxID=1443435 RepID=UPI00063F629C|nr:hypothetical protein [Aneurinibacillus tyrosinisolvens]
MSIMSYRGNISKEGAIPGICLHCGDIIDFGYPSFPAYRLAGEEADASILCGQEQKKLVAVG